MAHEFSPRRHFFHHKKDKPLTLAPLPGEEAEPEAEMSGESMPSPGHREAQSEEIPIDNQEG